MRLLLTSMILTCCTLCFAQETSETPAEVTTSDDGGDNAEVSANVDSHKDFDCGCGSKDKKPKI